MSRLGSWLAGLGAFVWDFLVGDDWRTAAGIAVVFGIGMVVAATGSLPDTLLAPAVGLAVVVVVTLVILAPRSR